MKNKNLIESFINAFRGVLYTVLKERNMKVHLAAGILVFIIAIWLHVSRTELAILCLTIAVVVCFELINTAMEVVVDFIVDVYHPKAKIIKDVSAGAVFVSAFFSIIIGAVILGEKLITKLAVLAG
ncbi:undecaprenol kinase/diacylglycerol kinase (ATP) [Ruminiclostridium sufflavum DSM 19573]|uniref:Undecaprenol kinase/diacylglycerol kinase (ATP) n=1 Tax=Ruminiclostridium sufflavum DSM 19573 TaxID=1121337 RepID=A0A318XLR3_9FIRM|nr:diacylglycerol kinase family protein [Ruminiclostridium sufflavum]PYG88558.1 undecaprenol kinase/diacylglycerol kinase (ATP) [Ruminiclostridium sufflavum DSM 19573]